MKYPSKPIKKLNTYSVVGFDGGIESNPFESENGRLAECKNMWYYNGAVTTRPGISTDTEKFVADTSDSNIKELTLTDTVYYKDGRRANIAYYSEGDSISYENLHVLLVFDDCSFCPIGMIEFHRITDDEFYVPENIFFVSANPTFGGGIYAFVTSNSYGTPGYSVFEVNSELTSWYRLSDSDFYIPTVYINGRGNRYAEANRENNIVIPEPECPEQLNLLSSMFTAYFTSDGISTKFTLPFSNLDNSSVICRIYIGIGDYVDFIIPGNSNSTQSEIYGETITAYCDRTLGAVYFKKDTQEYSIPRIYQCEQNNIRIYAYKTESGSRARIIGSKRAFCYDSYVYVYGNDLRPNELYAARLSNPLYFPKNSKTALGSSTDAVTAMGVQNGKVIAFKSGEIYRIKSASLSDRETANAFPDGNNGFILSDRLESVQIDKAVGCEYPDTVCNCGNRLVWLGSNGRVYALATTTFGNQNNVYDVSSVINGPLNSDIAALSQYDSLFGFDCRGYYMLFVGNRVYVMDHRTGGFGCSDKYETDRSTPKSLAWYIWDIPESVKTVNGICFGDNPIICCINKARRISYFSTFSHGGDSLLSTENFEIFKQDSEIKSFISTVKSDLGAADVKKRIKSVTLHMSGDITAEVTVCSDRCRDSRHLHIPSGGVVTIFPRLPATYKAQISLSSSERFYINRICFNYE